MEKSKIYTGTGDRGTTSLVGGQRVSKAHQRIESYGTIDELNSFIGLLITSLEDPADPESIARIEGEIDRVDSTLPKMRHFVLPGGCRSASLAHVCRTVCRRAERQIYRLAETDPVEEPVLVFINRLSDYLFVLARKECLKNEGKEIIWDSSCV